MGYSTTSTFASKFTSPLNKHSTSSRSSLLASVQSSITVSQLSTVDFSVDDVIEARSQLKNSKTDSSGLSIEHLRSASPVIAELLPSFFSSLLCHGLCLHALEIVFLSPYLKATGILPPVIIIVQLLSVLA